jgi:hypothetical protein
VSDHPDVTPEPREAPPAPDGAAPGSELERPDPRLRPPDPAGTQPKWDPASLLPRRAPAQTAGTLWAPPGERPAGERPDGERDREHVAAATRGPTADAGAAGDAPAVPAYSRYSHRFQFVLGALIAVGAAAIVLLVAVVVGRGDDRTAVIDAGPAWSQWRPLSDGIAGAQQIAEHVGREYRLPNGQQLVGVTGGAMEIAGLPVTIAIRETAAQGGDINFVDGSGVLYRLCGLGKKCAIEQGEPSAKRHMLLRREALELALYSFRYLGVSDAVVIMPAGKATTKVNGKDKTKTSTEALLFRRGDHDVAGAVTRPLDATLVPKTPSVNGVTRSPDASLVDAITTRKLFNFSFQQANQDARAFLVLDPLAIR